MSTEPPKRAIEIKINIGADDWDNVRHQLHDILYLLSKYGEIPESISGSPGSNRVIEVELNPEMTNEKYFEELGKYKPF